jgi:hypothetical protein
VPRFQRLRLLALASLVFDCLLSSGVVHAWDWRDAPFDLRLGLALDRASTFTDVTALSASSAYPFGSAVNPANDDFLRAAPYDFTFALTGTGVYIPFETRASITAGSGRHETLRLDSEDFALGYSHLLEKRLALGGEFKVTRSTLKFESAVDGFPLNTQSAATGYDVRFGALGAPAPQWLVGLTVGAGWSYARTSGEVTIPADFGGAVTNSLPYVHAVRECSPGRRMAALRSLRCLS